MKEEIIRSILLIVQKHILLIPIDFLSMTIKTINHPPEPEPDPDQNEQS